MCRGALSRPGGAALNQGALNYAAALEQPINLSDLFAGDDGELGADGERPGARQPRFPRAPPAAPLPRDTPRPATPFPADLALLALFSSPAADNEQDAQQGSHSTGSSAGSPVEAPSTAPLVIGQALTTAAPQVPAAVAPAVPPQSANAAVQHLQMQAVMQHQAAIMQNPMAFPAAAQMYQQAMLQQQQQQQMAMAAQAYSSGLPPLPAAAAPLPLPPLAAPSAPALPLLLGKRGKSVEEAEEQTERIKKRRRESAQRSRQRKNCYMKGLEMENRALKLENERLRCVLRCAWGWDACSRVWQTALGLGASAARAAVRPARDTPPCCCCSCQPAAALASLLPLLETWPMHARRTHVSLSLHPLDCSAELMKSTGTTTTQPKASSGSGSVSRQPATADASERALTGTSSEGAAPLCAPLLATAATLDGASSALPDPLALMPTAELMSFAF